MFVWTNSPGPWIERSTIDVRLSSKVDDSARSMSCKQLADQYEITDITLHENVACIVAQACQVLQVAGVGELVEGDDRLVGLRQPVQHKVTANETGAAGDEKGRVLLQEPRFNVLNPKKRDCVAAATGT